MEDEPLDVERLLYPKFKNDIKGNVKIFCPFTNKEITGYKGKIKFILTFNGCRILDYDGLEHVVEITEERLNWDSLPVPDYKASHIMPAVNIIITRLTMKSPYYDKSFSIELDSDKGWKYKDFDKVNISGLKPGKYRLDGYYSLKFSEYHGDLKLKFTKIRTLKKLLKEVYLQAFTRFDIVEDSMKYKNEFYGTATPVNRDEIEVSN